MRVLTVFIFLFSFFLAKAQNAYTPMTDGEKYWWYYNVDDEHCRPMGGYMIGLTNEDTLVSGLEYKKLYQYYLSGNGDDCYPPSSWPCYQFDYPYEVNGRSLMGLIRDDIASEKVYFLPLSDESYFCSDEEYLLFDFAMSQGDSLDECVRTAIQPLDTTKQWGVVDTITQEMLYGKERKVVTTKGQIIYCGLLPGPIALDIISGVGFEHMGLFQPNELLVGTATMMTKFCEGSWADCNIISSNKDVIAIGGAAVFPNPVFDELAVELPSDLHQKAAIKFYGITGRFLRKQELQSGVNSLIVSDLPKGMVIYRIVSKGGVLKAGKLVKME